MFFERLCSCCCCCFFCIWFFFRAGIVYLELFSILITLLGFWSSSYHPTFTLDPCFLLLVAVASCTPIRFPQHLTLLDRLQVVFPWVPKVCMADDANCPVVFIESNCSTNFIIPEISCGSLQSRWVFNDLSMLSVLLINTAFIVYLFIILFINHSFKFFCYQLQVAIIIIIIIIDWPCLIHYTAFWDDFRIRFTVSISTSSRALIMPQPILVKSLLLVMSLCGPAHIKESLVSLLL